MTVPQRMLTKLLLDYEIAGSGWASWIGWPWLQDVVARHFARKVRRKMRRYQEFIERREATP